MSGTKDTYEEDRFWRALKPETPRSPRPVELTHDLSDLNAEERHARREALKSMLEANEARQRDVLRNRPPSMALGQTVLIVRGTHAGQQAIVLDADFIQGRVQLDVKEAQIPLWLPFSHVGSVHD